MFVVFEGPDGCGKSTHAARLKERLGAKFFKFPNKDSVSGKLIYEHLDEMWDAGYAEDMRIRDAKDDLLNSLIFQGLQSMNRMELAEDIKKARTGDLVIDRYWPSGYAYGRADGLDGEYLINLHKSLPQPDLFLLLDIDIKDSVERRPERRDRYEKNLPFMETVMKNYRELWATKPGTSRWEVINARGTHEETAKLIEDCVAKYKEIS